MTGIAEFLTARLDEDEAVATADEGSLCIVDDSDAASDAFVERFDYRRVLAEVAAKRALLKRLDEDADACTDDAEWRGASLAEWQVIAHLAAVYADHPDYDPSWRVPTTEENDHG